MGTLYLSERERKAIKAVDENRLRSQISDLIDGFVPDSKDRQSLSECGAFVDEKKRLFEKRVSEHRESRSAAKKERTLRAALLAGEDILFAVSMMKERVSKEEKDDLTFRIDDIIPPDCFLNNDLSVRIHYQWRDDVDSDWRHGGITFFYRYKRPIEPSKGTPKRKPSLTEREERNRIELQNTWEHLRDLALYSLQRFFRDGGDGNAVPEKFEVVIDATSFLNNFSTDFWRNSSADRKENS